MPWLPKSVILLRNYDRQKFIADLAAGVTVGLVALPLAMAFAIASGLTPQAGIYCAVVTGFIISALGGSRVQIGGPTGAFVVVISGIVAISVPGVEEGAPSLAMTRSDGKGMPLSRPGGRSGVLQDDRLDDVRHVLEPVEGFLHGPIHVDSNGLASALREDVDE
jgi:hypothetical protein